MISDRSIALTQAHQDAAPSEASQAPDDAVTAFCPRNRISSRALRRLRSAGTWLPATAKPRGHPSRGISQTNPFWVKRQARRQLSVRLAAPAGVFESFIWYLHTHSYGQPPLGTRQRIPDALIRPFFKRLPRR